MLRRAGSLPLLLFMAGPVFGIGNSLLAGLVFSFSLVGTAFSGTLRRDTMGTAPQGARAFDIFDFSL
jgi:hypothetical protein